MDIQRIRNLTTGILHTKMEDIHEDIEYLVVTKGVTDNILYAANRALQPFLRERLSDQRFWNEALDYGHTGDIPLAPMTHDEQKCFWSRYRVYRDYEDRERASKVRKM